MPSASMPWKVVLPRMVRRLTGLRKRGRATPITAIMTTSAAITPISSGSAPTGAGAGGEGSVMKSRPLLAPGCNLAGVDQMQQAVLVDLASPRSSPASRPR